MRSRAIAGDFLRAGSPLPCFLFFLQCLRMRRVIAYIEKPDNIKLLLIVALLFRLVLIPNPGFEADISFWKSWGLAVKDFGIVKGLPVTNFNYPTPFAYVLSWMAIAYS